MSTLKILSPSKVNLTLNILGKREDGYHDLHSIFQPINLFDEIDLSVEEGEGIELHTFGKKIPDTEENIAIKAARLFIDIADIKKKISISLNKRIPIGAGLGGGSGNAAAILVGLNKILNIYKHKELLDISSKLGSDVPFFISSNTSLVEGVGDQLTLLNSFPLFHYVLLFPKINVSTKSVYENFICESYNDTFVSDIERFNNDEELPLKNDLEESAFKLFPELKRFKEMFYSLDVKNVVMTGSGSTIIGVFRQHKQAEEIYNYLNISDEFEVYLAEGIKGWHYLID